MVIGTYAIGSCHIVSDRGSSKFGKYTYAQGMHSAQTGSPKIGSCGGRSGDDDAEATMATASRMMLLASMLRSGHVEI
jgi:hypothetical protein